MATFRNVGLSLHVWAKSVESAHKKSSKIVKRAGIKKVHAIQIIAHASMPNRYIVDIILKESIIIKTPAWATNNMHGTDVADVIASLKGSN